MDELLINSRYWYRRVRCVRKPAATGVHQQYHRHKSLLPAPPLDIQPTADIVIKLCAVGDFGSGGGRGAGSNLCLQISLYLNREWKSSFFYSSVYVADTNKNSNNKASVIQVFERGVRSPGLRRLVMSNIFSVSFLFRSPSRNPSPSSLALATKPPCSPSLCGYPGAPAASLLQDSLVRR